MAAASCSRDTGALPSVGSGDAARAADLASVGPDAAVDGSGDLLVVRVGLPCGGPFCDTSSGKVCCERSATCQAAPCAGQQQMDACDGPEDCVGGRCCLFIAPFFGTACAPSCDDPDTQRGVVCHQATDCAPGQRCLALEVAGGLKGCL